MPLVIKYFMTTDIYAFYAKSVHKQKITRDTLYENKLYKTAYYTIAQLKKSHSFKPTESMFFKEEFKFLHFYSIAIMIL